MQRSILLAVLWVGVFSSGMPNLLAEEPAASPKPIPQTRPEAKEALEALKRRSPRLPLPPPTAEELQRAAERSSQRSGGKSERGASGLGGGIVNNGRMRSLYLPAELLAAALREVPIRA